MNHNVWEKDRVSARWHNARYSITVNLFEGIPLLSHCLFWQYLILIHSIQVQSHSIQVGFPAIILAVDCSLFTSMANRKLMIQWQLSPKYSPTDIWSTWANSLPEPGLTVPVLSLYWKHIATESYLEHSPGIRNPLVLLHISSPSLYLDNWSPSS